MESKALALGKQVKAEALNSSIHLLSVTLIYFLPRSQTEFGNAFLDAEQTAT